MQKFSLAFTGTDGKPATQVVEIDAELVAIAQAGMSSAFAADNSWALNHDAFVTAFYPSFVVPAKAKLSEITEALRGGANKPNWERLNSFLAQSHPLFVQAAALLALSAIPDGGEYTDEKGRKMTLTGDAAKVMHTNLWARIRGTASAQAIAIVGYFGEANEDAAAQDARKQVSAYSLINGYQVAIQKLIDKPRGLLKEANEMRLLVSFVDATKRLLAEDTKARVAKSAATTLGVEVSLETPQPAAPRDQSEKKASKVIVTKGMAVAK